MNRRFAMSMRMRGLCVIRVHYESTANENVTPVRLRAAVIISFIPATLTTMLTAVQLWEYVSSAITATA